MFLTESKRNSFPFAITKETKVANPEFLANSEVQGQLFGVGRGHRYTRDGIDEIAGSLCDLKEIEQGGYAG